jgi:hypothetical protein
VRIYSAPKVARLLAENEGHFTIRLRRYDAAWMPHSARDLYAPGISGPADEVTYTALDNGLVKVDVIRGDHRWVFTPATQHGVGPAPTTPSSRNQRRLHAFLSITVLIYLGLVIAGFALGYGPIGRHSIPAGFAGAVGGYLAAYVVNLAIVIALHARHARQSPSMKDNARSADREHHGGP